MSGFKQFASTNCIEPALLHTRRFRVAVNIAQRIQRPSLIRQRKSRTVIALLPEMPRSIHQTVKAHSRIPVQPVHNFRQLFRFPRLNQIMHMITHDAERVDLEPIFVLTALQPKQQNLLVHKLRQSKIPIVAAGCNVIAITQFELTQLS